MNSSPSGHCLGKTPSWPIRNQIPVAKKIFCISKWHSFQGEATEACKAKGSDVSVPSKERRTKGRCYKSAQGKWVQSKEHKSTRITRIIIFYNTLFPCKCVLLWILWFYIRVFCIHFYTLKHYIFPLSGLENSG